MELDVEELRPELDIVRSAGKEMKACQRFRGVLAAVLAVGNALNGATFRGGARGFKLDALLKVFTMSFLHAIGAETRMLAS